MGLLDDTVAWGGGFGLGIGAAVAAPGLLGGTGSVVRSLAKLVIRTALVVSDGVRAAITEVSEQVGDLVAEVQAERAGHAGAHKRRERSIAQAR